MHSQHRERFTARDAREVVVHEGPERRRPEEQQREAAVDAAGGDDRGEVAEPPPGREVHDEQPRKELGADGERQQGSSGGGAPALEQDHPEERHCERAVKKLAPARIARRGRTRNGGGYS